MIQFLSAGLIIICVSVSASSELPLEALAGKVLRPASNSAHSAAEPHFDLETHPGIRVRIVYDQTNPACQNQAAYYAGYSARSGETVEILAEKISENLYSVCRSKEAYIHFLTIQAPTDTQINAQNLEPATKSIPLKLRFFLYGNLLGASYEINLEPSGSCLFKKSLQGGQIQTVSKTTHLAGWQMRALYQSVLRLGLATLPSQDFAKYPLNSNQPYWQVHLATGSIDNTLQCAYPSPLDATRSLCQDSLLGLQKNLSEILGEPITV